MENKLKLATAYATSGALLFIFVFCTPNELIQHRSLNNGSAKFSKEIEEFKADKMIQFEMETILNLEDFSSDNQLFSIELENTTMKYGPESLLFSLVQNNMTYGHQLKYFNNRHRIMDNGDLQSQLKYAPTASTSFVDLGTWFYRHIWKSGGTTIQNLGNHDESKKRLRQKGMWIRFPRHIFTFVRDPIDHFISGFKESGARRIQQPNAGDKKRVGLKKLETEFFRNAKNDFSSNIIIWLDYVKEENHDNYFWIHAMPQIDFFINKEKELFQDIELVADIKEIRETLTMLNIPFSGDNQRTAIDHKIKNKYFNFQKNDLSTTAITEICHYVAIDYCFFDFNPPPCCKDFVHDLCQN